MTLSAGTKLGPYEILAPIGAGGMGEVYKAKDTRLERTVAVKVLPSHLSSSPEVRQRFEREAKTVSQLSHPHICALHDVGSQDGVEYLVMELLDGETLADRLAKGALPLEQTLRYGQQIADALDKAHRQGIVHRDLKPGNVMLTKTGVKLLDFGLAKAMTPPAEKSSLTSLPTQQGLTQEGTILGTFQYMAPEQLEGKDADARTDIFAFGAVLYEMATGKKAFSAASQASLITAIMSADPPSISATQPMSPPALDRVVRTCLAKDPEDRWQSAKDLGRELAWTVAGPDEASPAPRRGSWLPWSLVGIATLAAVALGVRPLRSTAAPPERVLLSIVPPQRTGLTDFFVLSPDGRKLAFVGIADGKSLIRIRDLDSDAVRTISGTAGAEVPFWSPDGRSLGFFAQGKMRRVDVANGSIQEICDAALLRGASWNARGDIVFAPTAAGALSRVSASGGAVTPVTVLEKGDSLHRWPQFLPNGRQFLFFVKTGRPEETGIYMAALDRPGRKLILRSGGAGSFIPPDTLLSVQGEALVAQRFDPVRGELSGDPETVTRPIMGADTAPYRYLFANSQSGAIVFRPGSAQRRLAWFDRAGNVLAAVGPEAEILSVSLSHDGQEAAMSLRQAETGTVSVWTLDLARNVAALFAESGFLPVWARDGKDLFYRHEGSGWEIRRKPFPAGFPEATILSGNFVTPTDVSPDGQTLLFEQYVHHSDIAVTSVNGDRKQQAILESESAERLARFSPDGRWIVYVSNEPGQYEVFVRRFPVTEEKRQISAAGGQQPIWSGDGKEIFYAGLDGRLMAVPVSAGSVFSVGTAQPLFRTSLRIGSNSQQYGVTPDGRRFLIIVPTQDFDSELFRVLLNWRASWS